MPDRHETTILVVDDDEGHVELVRRNLRRIGVANSIVALDSAEAALARSRHQCAPRIRAITSATTRSQRGR